MISLICATLDGSLKIDNLLKSLKNQIYRNFEIIVVDQSQTNKIELVCKKYINFFKIKYLRIKQKGLSKARNYGLKYADGNIIGFPDDDCSYFKDTLKSVDNYFKFNRKVFCIIGRDVNQKNLQEKELNTFNFYRITNSNTIFIKKNDNLIFDENFGVGAPFYSNEDTLLIMEALLSKKVVFQVPSITVKHDIPDISNIEDEKIKKYSFGAGKFMRRYFGFPGIVYQFFLSFIYHFLLALKALFLFNFKAFKKRLYLLFYRILGFIK